MLAPSPPMRGCALLVGGALFLDEFSSWFFRQYACRKVGLKFLCVQNLVFGPKAPARVRLSNLITFKCHHTVTCTITWFWMASHLPPAATRTGRARANRPSSCRTQRWRMALPARVSGFATL